MKRYFLIFLVLVVLFSGCAIDKQKMRTATGVLGDIIGTFKLNSGIEGKLVTWSIFKNSTKWYEEALPSVAWPFYPADMISEKMLGHKVKITYRITQTIPFATGYEGVLLIHVEKIDIL